MKRFNIALLPVDSSLQGRFSAIAQSYFRDTQDGYILGAKALAHVTLCQFYAQSEDVALRAYESFGEKHVWELAIEQFRLRGGRGTHNKEIWAEFLIQRDAALMEYQIRCAQHLIEHNLKSLTPVNGYSPHITLARILKSQVIIPNIEEAPRGLMQFIPAVGLSTESGVFVRALGEGKA